MKVILDTNVLVSGIFFKGPPNGFSGVEVIKPSEFLEKYLKR